VTAFVSRESKPNANAETSILKSVGKEKSPFDINSPKYVNTIEAGSKVSKARGKDESYYNFESKVIDDYGDHGIDLGDLDLNLDLNDNLDFEEDHESVHITLVDNSEAVGRDVEISSPQMYAECRTSRPVKSQSSKDELLTADSFETQAVHPSYCGRLIGDYSKPISVVLGLSTGAVACGGSDSMLRIVNTTTSQGDFPDTIIDGQEAEVLSIAEVADPRRQNGHWIVAGCADSCIRVWKSSSFDDSFVVWRCESVLRGHLQAVLSLASHPPVSPPPDPASASPSPSTAKQHSSSSLTHRDSLMIVSGSADHTVRLWGMVLDTVSDKDSATTLSPFGDDQAATSWVCFRVLRGHKGAVNAVAVMDSSSGRMSKRKQRVVSASADGTVRLWDVLSGELLQRLTQHTGSVTALALRYQSPSEQGSGGPAVEFVVSASCDHTVRLWNVFTEQSEAELRGHRQAVLALAVLRDGRIASACADGSIRLWGPPTMRRDNAGGGGGWGWLCQVELQGHSQAVQGLSVLPDDRLVSGAADGHIRLWESRAE